MPALDCPGCSAGIRFARTPAGDPVTRPSCLECVEKHLGAAYVLLAEIPAGHKLARFRAIGHLHEAQDESQAWPELSAAIRDARISYQAGGAMPDWEILEAATRSARAGLLR